MCLQHAAVVVIALRWLAVVAANDHHGHRNHEHHDHQNIIHDHHAAVGKDLVDRPICHSVILPCRTVYSTFAAAKRWICRR